jgi:hypothetical protein
MPSVRRLPRESIPAGAEHLIATAAPCGQPLLPWHRLFDAVPQLRRPPLFPHAGGGVLCSASAVRSLTEPPVPSAVQTSRESPSVGSALRVNRRSCLICE